MKYKLTDVQVKALRQMTRKEIVDLIDEFGHKSYLEIAIRPDPSSCIVSETSKIDKIEVVVFDAKAIESVKFGLQKNFN